MTKKPKKDYRKDKAIIQFFTNHNIRREFVLICNYRGLKMKHVLEKFVIEFNKKNEVKVLQ